MNITTKLARMEAEGINALRPRHDLRVHVSGDARTRTAAKILGCSMVDYERRSKRQGFHSLAYTYTHSWQAPYNVHYSAWQGARVLASIDNVSQYDTATQDLGYPACTMVTPEAIPTHKTDNNLMVLCPHEKHKIDCRDCRLCFMSMDWLKDNRVIIMFPAHGQKKFDAINGKGGCYAALPYINGFSDANKVTVTEYSQGKKIKGMSVSYASIEHTCPTTCAMYPKQLRK